MRWARPPRLISTGTCSSAKPRDAHYVAASKWFTAFWGLVALGFALFANLVENLIQAVNIVGSIFYGVMLGLFLVAFFLRRVGGTAVFWARAGGADAGLRPLFHSHHQLSLVSTSSAAPPACCSASYLQAVLGRRPAKPMTMRAS